MKSDDIAPVFPRFVLVGGFLGTGEATLISARKVPVWMDRNDEGEVCYLPFAGCQSGWRGQGAASTSDPTETESVQELLEAFTWHSQRGQMPTTAELPFCGTFPITKTKWPDYGFDEWFLGAAIYPRVAHDGILNFVPSEARSTLLTLDTEYATWANPSSELIFFPTQGKCC